MSCWRHYSWVEKWYISKSSFDMKNLIPDKYELIVEGCNFSSKYENVMKDEIAECWNEYAESLGHSVGGIHRKRSNLKTLVYSNQWFQPDVYVCKVRDFTDNIIESLTFVSIVWYVDNKDFAGEVIFVYKVCRVSNNWKLLIKKWNFSRYHEFVT